MSVPNPMLIHLPPDGNGLLQCCGKQAGPDTAMTDRPDLVTCKPDPSDKARTLAEENLEALLSQTTHGHRAITGPDALLESLRISAARQGINLQIVEIGAEPKNPHADHDCFPPEARFEMSDRLAKVLEIVQGNRERLREAGFGEEATESLSAATYMALINKVL